MSRRRWALVFAGASLVACSSTDSGTSTVADGGPGAVTPGSDAAGVDAQAVTQGIGASGGTVSTAGVELTIPAGALATDVSISITPDSAPVPAGYTALSPLYTFGPAGTVFLKPVTVAFTVAASGSTPAVFWSNTAGVFDALPTTISGTSVAASVDHLSNGFAGVAPGNADSGDDAGAPDDAGGVADSGLGSDAGSPVSGTDSGIVDAGSLADSTPGDSGGPGATDGGAIPSDGGFMGITVTVGSTPMTFGTNVSIAYVNGLSTIQADDNATSTHWHFEIEVTLQGQQTCSAASAPFITYTHFANGTLDAAYYSNQWMGYCTITVASTAVSPGERAQGTFIGGVDIAREAGVGDASAPIYLLSNGTYDVIR